MTGSALAAGWLALTVVLRLAVCNTQQESLSHVLYVADYHIPLGSRGWNAIGNDITANCHGGVYSCFRAYPHRCSYNKFNLAKWFPDPSRQL